MAKTTKLTVKTDVGTFTRTTARTYTHLVVAKGVRHEILEAERLTKLQSLTNERARYAATILSGIDPQHPEHVADWLAAGLYAKWVAGLNERIAAIATPITEDRGTSWDVLGWCGRPDLAFRKATEKGRVHYYDSASRHREVRVYAVADGSRAF